MEKNGRCVQCQTFITVPDINIKGAKIQCPRCGARAEALVFSMEYKKYLDNEKKKKDLAAEMLNRLGKYQGEQIKIIFNGTERLVRDGKGINIYPNGDRYEGSFSKDQRHGVGTCLYVNGDKYDGKWENDKKHGPGTMYYKNGDKYKGYFANDNYEGQGLLQKKDGCYCKGLFKGNKFIEGMAKIDTEQGIYQGSIKDGKLSGKGIVIWDNGNKYDGTFLDGERHGKGIYYWSNGDRYEGEFSKQKRTGKGTYYTANGSYEEATWIDGNEQGMALFYYPDGRIEERRYDNGKIMSKRILNPNTYALKQKIIRTSSGMYIGDVKDGKCTGKGVYYWNNGDYYEGSFENDLREGFGVMHFANGDRHETESVHNKQVGQSYYYFMDGRIEERTYNPQGVLLAKKLLNPNTYKPGQVVLKYDKLDRYVGDVKKGDIRHGRGVYYYKDGDYEEVTFKENRREGEAVYYYRNGKIERRKYEFGELIEQEELKPGSTKSKETTLKGWKNV